MMKYVKVKTPTLVKKKKIKKMYKKVGMSEKQEAQ